MNLKHKVFVTKNGIKKEIKSKTVKLGNVYCNNFIKSHQKGTAYRTTFDEPIHLSNDDNMEIIGETIIE